MSFRFLIIALSILLTTNAYALDEALIDLKYGPPANEPGKTIEDAKAVNCNVIVKKPMDIRLNKETLGANFRGHAIVSKQPVVDWLEESMLNLRRVGLTATSEFEGVQDPLADATVLSMDLKKAYIWFHGLNMYATLVVTARLQRGDRPEEIRHYRINGTKANWATSNSEFVSTFNIAVHRLQDRLLSEVLKQCEPKNAL
ncbi:hypothetical protein [Methylobacillus flagellatus]|uniref:hypothetical protein n=1 Tax=Methylobacillus flagellatus TaxID=405 RepID=UPI0010F84D57|nr:hypothetical protein [Methylobacillus flagellatus]